MILLKAAATVFSFTLLLVEGGLTSALRTEARSERELRKEFVEQMQAIEDEKRDSEMKRSLHEQLLSKATLVDKSDEDEDRELYGYGYDDFYQYSGGYQSSIDLSTFAIKYVGCQNIHTYSDDLAASGTTPLAMDRFVVFRLCDAGSCSAYNKWGCNYNFGEYMMPMEDYLSIMAQYHFQQFNRYCQTCYDCMTYDPETYFSDDSTNGDDSTGDDQYTNSTDDYYAYNADDDDANGDDGRRRDLYSSYSSGNGGSYYGNNNYASYYGNNNYNAYNGGNYNGYNGGGNYNGANNYNGYNNGGNNNYNGYNNGGNNGYNYMYNTASNYYQQQSSPWYIKNGQCIFETVCSNYRKECKTYKPNVTFYEDFFTCTEFSVGKQVGYIGPHCRSDGRTIGIGIYDDESCNEYIGDIVDVSEYTSTNFDDDDLKNYYDRTCIPCNSSDSFALVTDDNYGSASAQTYPLCGALYDASAKCNLCMGNSGTYDSSQQADNAEEVCTYIESLIENNYNEFGEIQIKVDFDWHNWQSGDEWVRLVHKASTGQILGILFTMSTAIGLALYSIYLHKKLVFRVPWTPPKRVSSPFAGITSSGSDSRSIEARSEAGRISRINSGITAMRSRSIDSQQPDGESHYGGQGGMNYNQGAFA